MDHLEAELQLLLGHLVFLFRKVYQKVSSESFRLVDVCQLKQIDHCIFYVVLVEIVAL